MKMLWLIPLTLITATPAFADTWHCEGRKNVNAPWFRQYIYGYEKLCYEKCQALTESRNYAHWRCLCKGNRCNSSSLQMAEADPTDDVKANPTLQAD